MEYGGKKKVTRREIFLKEMDQVVPWQRLAGLIEPHYPKRGKGRPPMGVELMLRMYFLQQWFNLADEAMEDAIYDSQAMRNFLGLDLGEDAVPDATTLLKFRHFLERHSLTKALFEEVKAHLHERKLLLREGTVVDATIVAAPSSTKNAQGKRDPQMHQTKKGNQWHFGMKTHIGTDTRGLVHSLRTTAANVADITQTPHLLHGEEKKVYTDAGYTGAHKREELSDKPVEWLIAAKRSTVQAIANDALRAVTQEIERRKAQVRAVVENAFLIVKHRFGHRKVRYRGLFKNDAQNHTLYALANLVIAKKWLVAEVSA